MIVVSGTKDHMSHNPDPTQYGIRYGQPDINVIHTETRDYTAADTDKNCRIADI